jgi:uncharacterized protein (DUF433 family)
MSQATVNLIGRGLYTLTEASRLSRVPYDRIVRWTRGYRFRLGKRWHTSPPVIAAANRSEDGQPFLDFRDLIELRFLEALRNRGISMPAIRIAAERAREAFMTDRPFSTRRFKTDGRSILAEVPDEFGEDALWNLVRDQYELRELIAPLLTGLEYDEADEPSRWWPLTRKGLVVVDPARRFGAPIIAKYGIPTRILWHAVDAEGSIQAAAEWYEVDARSVKAALAFEREYGLKRAA